MDPNGTKQAPNTRTRMNRTRDRIPSASTLPFLIAQGGRFANQAGAPGGTSAERWHALFNGWVDEVEAGPAPTMKVDAWFKRTALNKVTVWVDVENIGNDVFDPFENGGTVGIIGFERNEPAKIHLPNLMRIIDWLDFEDVVEPGQKVRLEAEFTADVPTDFGKLQMVVMVEQEADIGWETNGAVMGVMGDPPETSEPEPTPPTMSCELRTTSPSLTVGGDATVMALIRADGRGAAGAEVTMMVDEGPNMGETSTFKTDATGESKWTYSGDEVGTDTVSAAGSYVASGFPDPIAFECGTTTIEWTAAAPEPTVAPPEPTEPPTTGDDFTIYLPIVLRGEVLR